MDAEFTTTVHELAAKAVMMPVGYLNAVAVSGSYASFSKVPGSLMKFIAAWPIS